MMNMMLVLVLVLVVIILMIVLLMHLQIGDASAIPMHCSSRMGQLDDTQWWWSSSWTWSWYAINSIWFIPKTVWGLELCGWTATMFWRLRSFICGIFWKYYWICLEIFLEAQGFTMISNYECLWNIFDNNQKYVAVDNFKIYDVHKEFWFWFNKI